MKATNQSCRNSSSTSIWEVPARKYATDTNQNEKLQNPILGFDALRTIGRIVRAILRRINHDPEPDEKSG